MGAETNNLSTNFLRAHIEDNKIIIGNNNSPVIKLPSNSKSLDEVVGLLDLQIKFDIESKEVSEIEVGDKYIEMFDNYGDVVFCYSKKAGLDSYDERVESEKIIDELDSQIIYYKNKMRAIDDLGIITPAHIRKKGEYEKLFNNLIKAHAIFIDEVTSGKPNHDLDYIS